MLAIHGGPGFSHHYLLTLTDLADERPVIFYDQLDSGNSDRPGDPANWTVERFVDEIDHVRNALGLDRLVVLGSSWGGSVAASYASRQPPGLVLASPLISTERWIADNTAYREQLPQATQQILDEHEAAWTTDSAAYQEAVMEFYTRHLNRMDPWPDELNRAFELANFDLYVTMWGNTEFNATGTLEDFDVSGELGRIEAPTLMILWRVRRGDAPGVQGLCCARAERTGRDRRGRLAYRASRAARRVYGEAAGLFREPRIAPHSRPIPWRRACGGRCGQTTRGSADRAGLITTDLPEPFRVRSHGRRSGRRPSSG